MVRDAQDVAEGARDRVERHEAEPDLVADHDHRTRVLADGRSDIVHGLECRVGVVGVVPQRQAEPQRQSVEQQRRTVRLLANGTCKIGADLDRRPVGRALAPVARDSTIELGIARQRSPR